MTEAPEGAVTIAGVLASATAALGRTSPTARLDAELLLAHVLGVERARLIVESQAELDGESHLRFDRLARRRMIGEPVAYLTGVRGFRALDLEVDASVLIPRPETEGVVEAAVAELPPHATVIDVGTGSGAIALALKQERPDLVVAAVDISEAALATALRNRERLRLDVSFSCADLLEGVPATDAVVANLPYVERDAPLPVDVAAFEPELALFGGGDGLSVIRRFVAQLAAHAWPRWAALEIGESQGAAVGELLHAAGFTAVEVRPDLSGRDRVVVAHRPSWPRGPEARRAPDAGPGR